MIENTKLREALRALTEIATASDDSTVKGLKQLAELRLTALQSQPAAPGVTGAVQTLIEALKADPEYAWAWHCNIAMAAFDEGLSHYAANKAAARFLSWLAQIDMTTHPDFPKASEQSAAAGVSDVIAMVRERYRGTKWGKAAECICDAVDEAILALRPQAVPMAEEPQSAPKLIGWRTENFLWETDDVDKARNWEPNIGVLPIFEGDPNTKLGSRGITAQAGGEG